MLRTLILAPEQVYRTLNRLAREVLEHNRGETDVAIFGIGHRGGKLSERFAEILSNVAQTPLSSEMLDVRNYRDDVGPAARPPAPELNHAVEGKHVILVDDVLFTGRTARAALDAIIHHGRPKSVQLVVLIDRGHRELPIRADFLGVSLKTKHTEHVVVEADQDFSVFVVED
jgi:pyrimidine operon attenuation protein/uracil phosphoribosyltransferase